MRAALVLLLAAFAAPSVPDSRDHVRYRNSERGPAAANFSSTVAVVFRFLPSAPTLAQQCTGAALTGTKGETLTFTRSSAQTCTKSDGSLVKLTANQPALEAGGIHLEAPDTNYLLNSEGLGTTGWTISGGAVTQNYANGPDGTATAERYQFSSAISSSTYQSVTVASGTAFTSSAYLQQTTVNPGGFGTVIVDGLTGAQPTCTCATSDGRACAIVLVGTGCAAGVTLNSTWVRVSVTAVFSVAKTTAAGVYRPGHAAVSETGDMNIWGMQLNAGLWASSYIPTAGTSATRNSTNLNVPTMTLSSTPSQALTWTPDGNQASGILSLTGNTGSDRIEAYNVGASGQVAFYTSTGGTGLAPATPVIAPLVSTRVATYQTASVLGGCIAGACTMTALLSSTPALSAATTVNALGYYGLSAASYSSGHVLNVCFDSKSGGCR